MPDKASFSDWTVLTSAQDASVNFTRPSVDGGMIECRFVRRTPEYFIVYLSSHTGCRHACRFCHLTSTGQTSFEAVDIDGFCAQAARVLAHYDNQPVPAQRVHFNWMARGEALSNPVVRNALPSLLDRLRPMAEQRHLTATFNISTILPKDLGLQRLTPMLNVPGVVPYYSLYSMDPSFRKRWLPKALSAEAGLDLLLEWQQATQREAVLHWAFIRGENDDEASVHAICDAVLARGLRVRFNAVRYNPFDGARGAESSLPIVERNFNIIKSRIGAEGSRIVPRVGFDVQASCGMFVQ